MKKCLEYGWFYMVILRIQLIRCNQQIFWFVTHKRVWSATRSVRKKKLWRKYFSANFFRKQYLQNTSRRLTLYRSNRSQMFFDIGALKKFAIFTGKYFAIFTGLKACNFIKKRLQYRYFPLNIAKFLRSAFFIKHLLWLLLPKAVKTFFLTP